ncbi:hypothetical protein CH373_00650 [Leptospira perolatii]|uniref:VWA domain-containing protein n=1 Tax=Leptospira perolatii TaxID=2023191 RepID=A0A2M9ZT71_9LEPT|nr:hypothetical protein CH360_00650 [Leptospira perolatii]PJZ75171.1 hypothetical protein CH373_00650 [Leptospira perolatii]
MILILSFFPRGNVIATSIAFLPGYWEGVSPKMLEGTPEKPFELIRLGQFYTSNIYSARILEVIKDPRDPEAKDYLRPEIFKEQLKAACFKYKADYIARDVLEIREKARIDRTVYDCNLSQLEEYSVFGRKDLFELYEKLTQKSFPLLPKKPKKNFQENSDARKTLQIFLVDGSFSYANERKEFMSLLESTSWRPRTSFRLAVFGENFSQVYPEVESRADLVRQWKEWKPVGKSTTSDLGNALTRLGRVLLSVDKPDYHPRIELIVLTNAKLGNSAGSYSSSLEFLAKQGVRVHIIYSSYSGPESRKAHLDASKYAQEFKEAIYYQRVATSRDNKTIVLKNGRLYVTSQILDPGAELDENGLEKIDLSGKYFLSDALNPWNLSRLFEEIKGEKILSAEPVRSNFSLLLGKSFSFSSKTDVISEGSKVLVKTGEKAFWMRFPAGNSVAEGKKGVWKVTFLSSSFSLEGVEVIPDSVEVYPYVPPKSLECDPGSARNYIRNTEKSRYDCVVKGEILEVSQH